MTKFVMPQFEFCKILSLFVRCIWVCTAQVPDGKMTLKMTQ